MRDCAVDDLRHYLRAWSRWVRAWRAPLGIPSTVAIVSRMIPTVDSWSSHEDTDETIEAHILREVDREIERLPPNQRAAVRLTYLNETLPAVFRSARMSQEEVRRLCNLAEAEMVPRLRIRGVVLGGV